MEPLTAPSKSTVHCTHCPKMCRFACPVAEATRNERHTPWAKQAALHDLVLGRRPWSRDAARTLHACLGCRGSTPFCVHGVEVPDDLFAGRAEAVERGVYRPAEWVVRRMETLGTPFARAGADRAAELLPKARSDGEWLLAPGCAGVAGDGGDVRAVGRLAGLACPGGYRVLADPLCGGYPLLALGWTRAFEAHRDRLATALTGSRRILASCPACLPILRSVAPDGAEVVHPLDLALRLRREGRLGASRPLPGRFGYHDPCHLARVEDASASAREALAGVFDGGAAEFLWSGRETRCAGGGGGLPATHPRAAWRVLEMRLEEFRRTGAQTLVTSCSTCRRRFRRAPGAPPVLDAVEALLQAAGEVDE